MFVYSVGFVVACLIWWLYCVVLIGFGVDVGAMILFILLGVAVG